LQDCGVPPVTALRGCRIILVVLVVVVTVDFFSITPSNFSFGLPFVVCSLTGFSFWFWLDGPAVSPRAVRFPLVGAVGSGLASVRTVLAGVATVEEVTLVEAVIVDVGLERVTEREDNLALTFQYTMDRCERGGRQRITHKPQGGVSPNSGYWYWAG